MRSVESKRCIMHTCLSTTTTAVVHSTILIVGTFVFAFLPCAIRQKNIYCVKYCTVIFKYIKPTLGRGMMQFGGLSNCTSLSHGKGVEWIEAAVANLEGVVSSQTSTSRGLFVRTYNIAFICWMHQFALSDTWSSRRSAPPAVLCLLFYLNWPCGDSVRLCVGKAFRLVCRRDRGRS